MDKEEIIEKVKERKKYRLNNSKLPYNEDTLIEFAIEETTKKIIKIIKHTHYITGDEESKAMVEIYRVLLIKELKRFIK